VPDCDHVVLADVQSDSNVSREVEVDGKRDELLVRHQLGACGELPQKHFPPDSRCMMFPLGIGQKAW